MATGLTLKEELAKQAMALLARGGGGGQGAAVARGNKGLSGLKEG